MQIPKKTVRLNLNVIFEEKNMSILQSERNNLRKLRSSIANEEQLLKKQYDD